MPSAVHTGTGLSSHRKGARSSRAPLLLDQKQTHIFSMCCFISHQHPGLCTKLEAGKVTAAHNKALNPTRPMPRLNVLCTALPFYPSSSPGSQRVRRENLLSVWPALITKTRDLRHRATLHLLRVGCRLTPRPSPHPCNSHPNTFPFTAQYRSATPNWRKPPDMSNLPKEMAVSSDHCPLPGVTLGPLAAAPYQRPLTLSLRDGK